MRGDLRVSARLQGLGAPRPARNNSFKEGE